ncbi:putative short-chain dehydrogenase [Eremomyces bilateralis CBS 781.70]|uniref:Short-chain dehydrogenase n=1 Tax=Eremomyces bilateralis CBS 781.70 TaxID=1392243 RepID=A0A6G1FQW9_9PEZI|nr:putative short-chain dehydrogenase [Eremomyces bilateralis CBS 781.70]KAF1808079.1 putative short-chain dehydrogenase [Eremomyces bilateralis CBS 781.70]
MADKLKPYADLYTNPQGVGDKRPTALRVVQDDGLVNAYEGKVGLITGGTNGIGVEAVRALHATGADVYFTARDAAKAKKVIEDIRTTSESQGKLDFVIMNMDSLQSVREAVKVFLSKSFKLNILINNAGIMGTPYSLTEDGFERQFGVNHLAHFLFTVLLLPTLEKSATPQLQSRVVNVSSSSHRHATISWEHYNSHPIIYNPEFAYGQSKTANIWMANTIDRKYGSRGVHGLSVGPGGIWTGLLAYTPADIVDAFKLNPNINIHMLSAEQGSATTLWAAVGRVWEGKGGEYLHDCQIAPPETGDFYNAMSAAAAPWAKGRTDDENRLWTLSEQLVGANAP